jgi:type VI secretion system secreted protein Hcp
MQIAGYKGNVTIPQYKDWIAIDNLEFGGERSIKMTIGDLTNREHSRLVLHKMTLLKQLDNTSNDLFMAMCNAHTYSQIEIHLCQNDANITPYAKFVLDKVMVAKYHTEVLVDANPMEEIEFAYTKIQRSYIKHDAMNKAQAPHRVGYDLETGKAM